MIGRAQARRANAAWLNQIGEAIPLPQSYYTSPLRRCIDTAELTFADLPLPEDRPFKVTIKEMVRETMGIHTCDQRSSKSAISKVVEQEHFIFEAGFAEADELWRPDVRESNAEVDARMQSVLNDIFAHDPSEVVSLTAHSGAIASMLRVSGHQEFPLLTGAVIPMLVRAEKVEMAPETKSDLADEEEVKIV